MRTLLRLPLVALFLFAAAVLPAATNETAVKIGLVSFMKKCPVCNGKGKLVLSPPDKGQHAGSAVSKKHWDVKSVCPVCEGKGRVERMRTFVRVENPPEGAKPCPKCGWSGCTKCRKCKGAGIVPCKNRGCEKGWIITQSDQLMSGKRRRPPTVTPCPECRGTGKTKCLDCSGTGGEPCRKCNGDGRDPREAK